MASNNSFEKNKFLVTCGPTWVPIDDVRFISNVSSGRLGHTIAKDLAKTGAKVTLLEGPVEQPLVHDGITIKKYKYYDELRDLVRKELTKKYTAVIHAAAVSDYKMKKISNTKIRSNLPSLTLELVRTEKIIREMKKINPHIYLVGFKLSSQISKITAKHNTKDLVHQAKCDLVVANSLKGNTYTGYILDAQNDLLAHETSRSNLSKSLIRTLKEAL